MGVGLFIIIAIIVLILLVSKKPIYVSFFIFHFFKKLLRFAPATASTRGAARRRARALSGRRGRPTSPGMRNVNSHKKEYIIYYRNVFRSSSTKYSAAPTDDKINNPVWGGETKEDHWIKKRGGKLLKTVVFPHFFCGNCRLSVLTIINHPDLFKSRVWICYVLEIHTHLRWSHIFKTQRCDGASCEIFCTAPLFLLVSKARKWE